MTQTSSPGGGWQGRLSAFLHVHRGSRASSRKSSRASDASDLSELGGPWLNLPLLLLSGATNVDPEELDLSRESADVSIKVSGATPEATTPVVLQPQQPPQRRRSIYNFFLRHQDAVETQAEETSQSPKKGLKASGTSQSLHPDASTAQNEEKAAKRGSIIRKKQRGGSVKARPTQRGNETLKLNNSDVSILVTEASPEAPNMKPTTLMRQQSEATVVQVLVHRESEEYKQEEDAPIIQVTRDSESDLTKGGAHVDDMPQKRHSS